jgi:hypothetical protein
MTAPEDIAVLRIELGDMEPLIWRHVAVRTSLSIKAVHTVIQAAMGWLDYHLTARFQVDACVVAPRAKLRRRNSSNCCSA